MPFVHQLRRLCHNISLGATSNVPDLGPTLIYLLAALVILIICSALLSLPSPKPTVIITPSTWSGRQFSGDLRQQGQGQGQGQGHGGVRLDDDYVGRNEVDDERLGKGMKESVLKSHLALQAAQIDVEAKAIARSIFPYHPSTTRPHILHNQHTLFRILRCSRPYSSFPGAQLPYIQGCDFTSTSPSKPVIFLRSNLFAKAHRWLSEKSLDDKGTDAELVGAQSLLVGLNSLQYEHLIFDDEEVEVGSGSEGVTIGGAVGSGSGSVRAKGSGIGSVRGAAAAAGEGKGLMGNLKMKTVWELLGGENGRRSAKVGMVIGDQVTVPGCMNDPSCIFDAFLNPGGFPRYSLFVWDHHSSAATLHPDGELWHLSVFAKEGYSQVGVSVDYVCHKATYIPPSQRPQPPIAVLLLQAPSLSNPWTDLQSHTPFLSKAAKQAGYKIVTAFNSESKVAAEDQSHGQGEVKVQDPDKVETRAWLRKSGVEDLGRLNRRSYVKLLSEASVIIGMEPVSDVSGDDEGEGEGDDGENGGVDRLPKYPIASLEAWCLGTPLILPSSSTTSKPKIQPPNLHLVKPNSLPSLVSALESARDGPMPGRWLPDEFAQNAFLDRLRKVLETDWKAEAARRGRGEGEDGSDGEVVGEGHGKGKGGGGGFVPVE